MNAGTVFRADNADLLALLVPEAPPAPPRSADTEPAKENRKILAVRAAGLRMVSMKVGLRHKPAPATHCSG